MAGTVHTSEHQAVSLLVVASELIVHVVRSPLLLDIPVQIIDPAEGAHSSHDGILVAGEVKKTVAISVLLVKGLGAIDQHGVVDISAPLEGRHGVRHMELGANGWQAEVVLEVVPRAVGSLIPEGLFFFSRHNHRSSSGPLSVLLVEGLLLLAAGVADEPCLTEGREALLLLLSGIEALGVDVIGVDVVQGLGDLVINVKALFRNLGLVELKVSVVALLFLHLVVQLLAVEAAAKEELDHGVVAVVLPVGHTVSDEETLQVQLIVFGLSLRVLFIDTVEQVGHVDTGVRLAREPELVGFELGVSGEPAVDGSQVVDGAVSISPLAVVVLSAGGESDTRGLVDVEHVSVGVEGVLVGEEVGVTIVLHVGSVLLDESLHGRAAGASVEPDQDGVIGGLVLGGDKSIEDILVRVIQGDVPRVLGVSSDVTNLFHGGDLVCVDGGI
mmetsp:Transcript_41862/g.64053  ORF Transcript_41862/g.64053 Transcript_41862/m.64053 type:complete len:442 (-) Transcript_41862:76-1401(-)